MEDLCLSDKWIQSSNKQTKKHRDKWISGIWSLRRAQKECVTSRRRVWVGAASPSGTQVVCLVACPQSPVIAAFAALTLCPAAPCAPQVTWANVVLVLPIICASPRETHPYLLVAISYFWRRGHDMVWVMCPTLAGKGRVPWRLWWMEVTPPNIICSRTLPGCDRGSSASVTRFLPSSVGRVEGRGGWAGECFLAAVGSKRMLLRLTRHSLCHFPLQQVSGYLDDCTCDVETIDKFNNYRLFPRLQKLLESDYFRYYKVLWFDFLGMRIFSMDNYILLRITELENCYYLKLTEALLGKLSSEELAMWFRHYPLDAFNCMVWVFLPRLRGESAKLKLEQQLLYCYTNLLIL